MKLYKIRHFQEEEEVLRTTLNIAHLGEKDIEFLIPEEPLSSLTNINQSSKGQTKRTRYSHLTSVFRVVAKRKKV